MCFHSKQSKKAQAVENRFKAKIADEALFQANDHINGFMYPQTPVVANDQPNVIAHYHWGLIPFWAKDDSIKKYTLNAKIETLHEKPSFRQAVNNRCWIVADGFYEWKWLDPQGKKKQRYLITRPDDELFAFAGIWSEWVDQSTGEIVRSYSIVTTAANELMSEIHNTKKRMPVILSPQNESDWLSGAPVLDFHKVDLELKAIEV